MSDLEGDGDGTPDCDDGCPGDPNKISAGTCGCGTLDTDTDGDGTADCNDGCPNDPGQIFMGVCGCETPDTDSDHDGTPDCNDGCPSDSTKTSAGACGCGVADTDADNDTTADCNDDCPSDANKTSPGACGCGNPDEDSDSDGTPDCPILGVVINEVLSNPDGDKDVGDWVEFYNAGNAKQSLAGWSFRDSNDENVYNFPSHEMNSGEYYVVERADLNFGLSKDRDEIRLFDSNGSEVDRVEFPATPNGVTYGRLPDGTANLLELPTKTQGSENLPE